MRPLHLTMSAFGPYPGVVEVDFTKLGREGLYLVTGDTGAGKTTIFDAIEYALFGQPSGAFRSDKMLRSDFATPDVPTYVELTFEYHGEQYRVRRNPAYERASLRQKGKTAQQLADAELWVPGRDLPYGKPKQVDPAIIELLGITREEFGQIVMIAQGDFRKLLAARTEERADIFRKLFGTAPYLQLQRNLDARRKELWGQVEDLRKQSALYARQVRVADDDPRAAAIAGACDASATGAGTAALIDMLGDLVREGQQRVEKLRERVDACNKQAETATAELDRARRDEARRTQMEAARKELAQLEEQAEPAQRALDEQEARGEEREELGRRLAVEREALGRYDELEAARKELTAAQRREQKAQAAAQRAEQEAHELAERLERARAFTEEHHDATAELERARSAAKVVDELARACAQLEKAQAELTRLQAAYERARATFEREQDTAQRIEKAFLDGQAGVLASKLEQGKPCPVCGALDHPSPARCTDEIPSEDEYRAARQAAERAHGAAQEAASACQAARGVLDERERAVDALAAPGESRKSAVQAQEASAAAQEAVRSAEWLVRQVDRARTACEELAEQARAAEAKREACASERDEAHATCAGLDERVAAVGKTLAHASRAEAQVSVKALASQVDALESALAQARRRRDEIAQAIGRTQARIETLAAQEAAGAPARSGTDSGQDGAQVAGVQASAAPGPADAIARAQEELAQARARRDEASAELSSAQADLSANQETLANLQRVERAGAGLSQRYDEVRELADAAGGNLTGKRRITFETYLQGTYFDRMLRAANRRLALMTDGRYELMRRTSAANLGSKAGLDLDVFDHHTGKQRDAASLSGGESFKASLAMALGLSDIVQARSGGIELDAMFIDEGFGSLDQESLQLAIKTLGELSGGGKLVGIISHVEELKESIDRKIIVEHGRAGSTLRMEV